MAYLRNTKDSIRIYESYEIKDTLKQRGYVFDGRGFWYKPVGDIESIGTEYQFLQQELDVDLLLSDEVSIEDAGLIGITAQEIAKKAAADPGAGILLMKKWSAINSWFNGPPSVPARETIF